MPGGIWAPRFFENWIGINLNIMGKIHYATGGLITPEKAEFGTLCGRKFSQGHSEIMQSGASGARNVTCSDCKWILSIQTSKQRSWYEVTDGNMSKSFTTQFDADAYLREMKKGFPSNAEMTEENKMYWKKHGKREYVVKVTQIEELVTY